MERILKIEEGDFVHNNSKYSGFEIVTDKQTIKLGIASYQLCCESWGYFMSEDDISSFIDSELIDVCITDVGLNSLIAKMGESYERCTMFVNITTSEGLLQFVAYNAHNGYYGHDAIVVSNECNHIECL